MIRDEIDGSYERRNGKARAELSDFYHPMRLVARSCRINGVLLHPVAFVSAENDKTYSFVKKDTDDLEIFETFPISEETRAPHNASIIMRIFV